MVLRYKLSVSYISHTGLSPSMVSYSKLFCYIKHQISSALQPRAELGLDFSLFARRYLGNLYDFFSSGYLDVSVPRVPYQTLLSAKGWTFMFGSRVWRGRLLDSETAGLQDYDSYPTSIAAICVLPRPKPPRHPLSALWVVFYKDALLHPDFDTQDEVLLFTCQGANCDSNSHLFYVFE